MKTMITALVAGGALLLAATPAQAAPKDPVRALKAKLVTGHGVRFTETTTLVDGDDKTVFQRRSGTFQFSRKGIAAADISAKRAAPMAGTGATDRAISIGKVTYVSGGMWKDKLPAGKTWYKIGNMPGGGSGFYGQVINPIEPKTLAALVKRAKRAGNAYTGKITFKELDKLSPWFASSVPVRFHNDTKVTYTITVSGGGLVTKVVSSYAADGVFDAQALSGKKFTMESRFSGWGKKVSIKAPDPDKVADKLDE